MKSEETPDDDEDGYDLPSFCHDHVQEHNYTKKEEEEEPCKKLGSFDPDDQRTFVKRYRQPRILLKDLYEEREFEEDENDSEAIIIENLKKQVTKLMMEKEELFRKTRELKNELKVLEVQLGHFLDNKQRLHLSSIFRGSSATSPPPPPLEENLQQKGSTLLEESHKRLLEQSSSLQENCVLKKQRGEDSVENDDDDDDDVFASGEDQEDNPSAELKGFSKQHTITIRVNAKGFVK